MKFFDKYIKFFMIAAVLTTPLIFCLFTYSTFEINKNTYFRLIILIALGLWITKIMLEREFKFKLTSFFTLYFLFFLISIISSLFSSNIISAATFFQEFLYFFILFIILLNFLKPCDFDRINILLIGVSALISIYAILQHFGIDFIWWEPRDLITKRSIGTLGNPIFLAFFLNMVIPITAYITIIKPRLKIFGYISFILLFTAMVFTYSRAGIFTFFLTGLLFLIAAWKCLRFYWKEIIVFLLLAVLLLSSLYYISRLGRQGNTGSFLGNSWLRDKGEHYPFAKKSDVNVKTRFFLWKCAIYIMAEKPFLGCGGGNFTYRYLKYRLIEPVEIRPRFSLPHYVHNDILQVGSELGIPAMLILIIIIIMSLSISFILAWKIPQLDEKIRFAGIFAACAAYWISSMFCFATIDNQIIWFYLLASLVVVSGYYTEKKILLSLPGRVLLFIFSMIFIIFAFIFQCQSWAADFYYKKAKIYEEKNEIAKSYIYYNNAIKLNFLSDRYWASKGKLLEKTWQKCMNTGKPIYYLGPEIEKSYFEASRLSPTNPYHYADWARFLHSRGKVENNRSIIRQSLSKYQQVLLLDPYNTMFINDAGLVFMSLNNYNGAERFFKESLKIYPDNYYAILNLGILYFNKKNYNDASIYFKKALKFSKNKEAVKYYYERINKARLP